MVTYDEICEYFERPSSRGNYFCPTHEDKTPSLTISEGEDRTLLHCHAGCSTEEILEAVELKWSDLYDEENEREIPEAVYDYTDERGNLLYQVVRFPGKVFRQRKPKDGGWEWRTSGVRRVLYKLPTIIKAIEQGKTIYVVEGEKDADRFSKEGLCATTAPNGAGYWKRTETSVLDQASRVIVIADNDEPGIKHGREIYDSINLPETRKHLVRAAEGKDAFSHFEAGYRADDFVPIIEDEWGTLDTIKMQPIKFLDKPLLQENAFHLLVGEKAVGKGTFLASVAARFTCGDYGERDNVIWIAIGEDSLGTDVLPRIIAAEGDSSKISFPHFNARLPDDLSRIQEFCQQHENIGLLIIDPLDATMSSSRSSNKDIDVRATIGGLNKLSEESSLVTIGVRHLGKSREGGALSAILGSVHWVNIPRVVLGVAYDDEEPDVRHVQVISGNRIRRGEAGRSFRIVGRDLPELDGEPVTRAEFTGVSGKDVEELIVSKKRPNEDFRMALSEEALAFLNETKGT